MKNKAEKKLQYIKLVDLMGNPLNRKLFRDLKETEMKQLVTSIKMNGVLNPAACYPTADGRYTMLSGHNRHIVLQFHGEEIGVDGMYCEVLEKPKSELQEMLMMVGYNLGRGLNDVWVIRIFSHVSQILRQVREMQRNKENSQISEDDILDVEITEGRTSNGDDVLYNLFSGIETKGRSSRDILSEVLDISNYQTNCLNMLCSHDYRKKLYDRILKVAKIKKDAVKQWDAGFDEIIAAVENDEITLNAACEQVRAFVAEIEWLEKKKQPKAEKSSKPKREPKPEKIDIEIEDADDDTQTPVLPTLRITHERLMEDFYATCDPDAPFTKIAEDKIAIPAADEKFVYVVDIDVLREHLMIVWKE